MSIILPIQKAEPRPAVLSFELLARDEHEAMTPWSSEPPTVHGFYQVREQAGHTTQRVAHWNGRRWSQTIKPTELLHIHSVDAWKIEQRRYNPYQKYEWRGLTIESTRWARSVGAFGMHGMERGIGESTPAERMGANLHRDDKNGWPFPGSRAGY